MSSSRVIHALLAVAAGVFLMGCQLVEEPEQACTAIGCDSQVVFELTPVDLVAGRTYEIEACLEDECWSATVEPPADVVAGGRGGLTVEPQRDVIVLVLPEGDHGGSRGVTLEIETGDGQTWGIEADIDLERVQPNGPACLPVCWQATITV